MRKALLSPRIADRYEVSAADAEAFARKLEEEGLLVAVFLSWLGFLLRIAFS